VLVTEKGPVDLMAKVPIEADEIEELMNAKPGTYPSGNGQGHDSLRNGHFARLPRKQLLPK
jgi:hypothetical protein